MSEEKKPSLGGIAVYIFLIVVGFGVFLFCGWAVVIGPWAFADILSGRHTTSMEIEQYFGHYIFFGFFVPLVTAVGIYRIHKRISPSAEAKKSKNFMKKCLKCDKEIPLASEECPYCGAKQK